MERAPSQTADPFVKVRFVSPASACVCVCICNCPSISLLLPMPCLHPSTALYPYLSTSVSIHQSPPLQHAPASPGKNPPETERGKKKDWSGLVLLHVWIHCPMECRSPSLP
ncbi:hypothetical protein LZ30DRAFT_711241 [Colletotrichum cereale]|nr:hypothetical protein LZ30DRAFT_711241 [Colletotrichum cereale]